jgi:hypothetical protein
VFTSLRYLFEQYHLSSGLIPFLVVRFGPMTNDLLSCSDHRTGQILLRQDAPQAVLGQAFRRETHNIMSQWAAGHCPFDPPSSAATSPLPPLPLETDQEEKRGVVLPFRRASDGMG